MAILTSTIVRGSTTAMAAAIGGHTGLHDALFSRRLVDGGDLLRPHRRARRRDERRRALEALAERRGRDLDAEGIAIVPMGGATTIGSFLELLGPAGMDVGLAGLCDAGAEDDVRRGLERAGLGSDLTRADMEEFGFFVCVADLEDELIRSLSAAAVERVVDDQGELATFRTFQRQPAWRGRTLEEQLRRFMGTHSGRKIRYARLLVGALDPARVPRPLDRELAHV